VGVDQIKSGVFMKPKRRSIIGESGAALIGIGLAIFLLGLVSGGEPPFTEPVKWWHLVLSGVFLFLFKAGYETYLARADERRRSKP
jgi:hypothetical protein